MRSILSDRNRAVLHELATSRSLLAFDYDGTLSPIVSSPEKAVMRPKTRALLAELCASFPCALISGRGRADLMRHAPHLPKVEYIGNHGLEWPSARQDLRAYASFVRDWRGTLERELGSFEGVEIEDKLYSISVHYRLARRKREARKALASALRSIRGARLVGGKEVVNLVPEQAMNKGTAVEKLKRLHEAERVLFVGDDVTDEDVFSLRKPWLVTVRVHRARSSAAGFYLRTQAEIDLLLRELLRLRRAAR